MQKNNTHNTTKGTGMDLAQALSTMGSLLAHGMLGVQRGLVRV